jgi:hypothetical protein
MKMWAVLHSSCAQPDVMQRTELDAMQRCELRSNQIVKNVSSAMTGSGATAAHVHGHAVRLRLKTSRLSYDSAQ